MARRFKSPCNQIYILITAINFAKNSELSRRHDAKLGHNRYHGSKYCNYVRPSCRWSTSPMSTIDSKSPAAPGSPTDGIAIGRIALVAASAAMGGFLFGFDTAVI